MTFDELKALNDRIEWSDEGLCYASDRARVLLHMVPEILALVEAVAQTYECESQDCLNPPCMALRAFNARMAEL